MLATITSMKSVMSFIRRENIDCKGAWLNEGPRLHCRRAKSYRFVLTKHSS